MDRIKAKQLLELSDNFYIHATRRMAQLGIWDDDHIEKELKNIAAEYALEYDKSLEMLGLTSEDLIKAFRNYQ